MIGQTLTAVPVEPEPPITAVQEQQTTQTENVATVIGAAGVEPTSNSVLGGSETVGLEQVKKRRGRPRKWGSGGKLVSPSTAPPRASSHSIDSCKKQRKTLRETERLQSLASTSGLVPDTATDEDFTPHVLIVYPRQLLTLFEEGYKGFFILCANGVLSIATIRHLGCIGNMVYEDWYDILSLKGSYMLEGMEIASGKTGQLTLALGDPKGEGIFCRTVEGRLIAASPTQVIVGTFKQNTESKIARCSTQSLASPRKISTESPSAPRSCLADSSIAATAKTCSKEDLKRISMQFTKIMAQEEKGPSSASEPTPITNAVLPTNAIPTNQDMWSSSLNGAAKDISYQGASTDINPSAPQT